MRHANGFNQMFNRLPVLKSQREFYISTLFRQEIIQLCVKPEICSFGFHLFHAINLIIDLSLKIMSLRGLQFTDDEFKGLLFELLIRSQVLVLSIVLMGLPGTNGLFT